MARFDPDYTAGFYDRYGAREGVRWQSGPRAGMQHALYCHHLRQRIGAGDRVLDAGCGPGTFTSVLLALGARVHCLDLSPVQLAMCSEGAPGADAYEVGSIVDLSRFPDRSFDCALALGGPISYCFERAGDAIRELARITRSGGLVGLSVMNLMGTIHRFLPRVLATPLAVNRDVVATGDLPRDVSQDVGHECHMFRVDELELLLSSAGLVEIELHASGWLIPDEQAPIPPPGSDVWNWLFSAELEASRESPGAGTHIIAWAKTP